MAHAQQMLDFYPRSFNVDAVLLAETIETLIDCANTCTQCADSCMSEPEFGGMAKCIRLNLDCADICNTTSRVVSRQTEYDANVTRPLLEACIAACSSCGDECQRHAMQMRHCQVCADTCAMCVGICKQLLTAMS